MKAGNLQSARSDYLCEVATGMVSDSTGEEQISQNDPWNCYYVPIKKTSQSQEIMKESTSETKIP